jgi:hypothetical protein
MDEYFGEGFRNSTILFSVMTHSLSLLDRMPLKQWFQQVG